MANIKISQLPAKGANLGAQDLVEVAEFTGTGYVSKSITGQEIIDAASGGGAAWGSITGTLSSQTDLQTALDAKQDDLVSGTNIKTINGSSVLGSGDLVVGGGLQGNSNVLNYFPSTNFGIDASVNAANSISQATLANTLYLYPFIPNKTITSVSLRIAVTTLGVGVNARILIYSDLNGFPNTKLYESANLDCSTIGNKSALTSFTFNAGTTYWLGLHISGVASLTHIGAGGLIPLFITNAGSLVITQYTSTITFGSAPNTYTYSVQATGAAPRIVINLS